MKDYEAGGAIPRIVEEKWDAAVLEIREGRVAREPGRRPLRILARCGAAVAASFVMLFTVAFVNPVFAESIPPLGEIIRFLKGEQSKLGAPAEVERADAIEENMQPVVPVSGDTKLTVEEAYCDKNTLVATIRVEPDEGLKKYDVFYPAATAKIDGTEIKGFSCGLEKTEDGSFVGVATADVSALDLSGAFTLEVSMNEATVVDRNTLVLNWYGKDGESNPYSPEELQELVNGMSNRERSQLSWTEQREKIEFESLSFSGTVTVDDSLRRVYQVNREENGCAVGSVTVAPGSTLIDAQAPEGVIFVVEDNMGNDIIYRANGGVYDPLYKGTTALTLTFYDLGDKNHPLAVFEIPIEGGYAEAWTPAPRTGEVTYIPALPELPEDWLNREPEDQVYELGETIGLSWDEQGIKQEFSFSNMRVYDSAEAAGIGEDEMQEYMTGGHFDWSSSKFVTLDLTVKVLEGEMHGVNMTAYGWPDAKYPGLLHDENIPGDFAYFSDAGQGLKNYGFAEIPGMTEYKGTVGFYWNEEDLKDGNLQLTLTVPDYEGQSSIPNYLHIEIPPYAE